LREGPTDVLGNAWLRAAEKGADVYDAEVRRADATLVDAGAAVAQCLHDIAVATATQQMEQVVALAMTLEELETVETCVLSASLTDCNDEVNQLIATAEGARKRMRTMNLNTCI
jgi:HPt (histidine-containing phosphotransfer) domain-containing protein